MTAFPAFDVDDLADFTGRPEVTFPGFVDEAINQAVFFIKMRTKVREWPDDPELQQAFKYAILDLANHMYLEREYDRYTANPFSSETIGSYSYSKSNAAKSALYTARPTGISWLDLLLELLIEEDNAINGLPTHGSTHVFENEDVYLDQDGERWAIGPRDTPKKRFGLGGFPF